MLTSRRLDSVTLVSRLDEALPASGPRVEEHGLRRQASRRVINPR